MTVSAQLSKTIDKVVRLIDLCAALQEENDLLRLENHSVKEKLSDGLSRNAELEEKLLVLALARSLEGNPSEEIDLNEKSLDIKQKITEFVREIDKCIVLLKK